jgi:PAS domain S-box-containing protein
MAIGFNNERQYLHSQQLKRLSVAVEQSPTSIVITDSDGKIEYVNPKFSELTGYGFQEAVGQNPRILKGGAVDQSVYEDLWGRISSGRPWRGEFLNKKKDGSVFWEMASISPLKDEQGRITHYVGIKEDITELKWIENKLKCANDELEQRVKERTSELAGVNLRLRAEIRKHELTERQLEGERASLEAMLAQKTLLAEVASRLNSTDPFSENLGAVIEKTGRRMKLDHVCVLNLNSMESIELTRLSSWSSSGESHSEFCGFWHDCERKDNLKNVLRQNSPYFWCAASEKNNGAEIASTHNIGATVCCPLTVGGEIKGLIAFARVNQMEWEEEDLSLFKAIADMVVNSWERERQMRARTEAEQKQVETVQLMERSSRLASIGVMAAGITHEINQPLNTIKLTADGAALWMERNSASIPAKIVERIAKVSSQVDRINKIIRHMKEFWVSPSSSQSGNFELNEALERSLALVVHQAESRGVRLEKSLSSRSLLVEGNIVHLEQIIVNLSMNALQAFDGVSHGDKRIKVVSRTVDMSAVIEVSDNAKGLPAGEEANIFDPFYSTWKTGQGMGLGLAIVDRFVKDLGGSITAENNSDCGASFTVTLPLQSNNGL